MIDSLLRKLIAVLLVSMLCGCGTLPNGKRWGDDVSMGNWQGLRTAVLNAAVDPQTWVPAAAALVLSAGDLDADLSDWAIRETPLFGSVSSADDTSNDLLTALQASALLSTLATPGGQDAGGWLASRSRGLLVGVTAVAGSAAVTEGLKNVADRRRPLKRRSDNSFPSGHATQAYAYATLTSRNADSLALSPAARRVLRISAKTLAATTAWARVEAGKHYPADVLAGAAIGHFLTAVIHDAFMGLDDTARIGLELRRGDGAMLSFSRPM